MDFKNDQTYEPVRHFFDIVSYRTYSVGTSSITSFLAYYKLFSVLILNMEQNPIDITVKTENLINAVQNEPVYGTLS